MKRLTAFLALILALTAILTACTPAGNTEPAETTEPTEATEMKNIYQKSDPSQDDTLNILMIGSSHCYYYVEELYGMLEAAGIKANVCNVYYSGCPLQNHWTWWKTGEANYEFFITNENGRVKTANMNLEQCLQLQNWDIISLQENSSKIYTNGAATHLQASKLYRTELWAYLKEQFPMSRHFWHQPWSYQVGTSFNGYVMKDFAQQQYNADQIREYAIAVCKELDLERVNTGEAWQIVRKDYNYDKLCARIGKGENHEGDCSHDGDWGGGQYLNACVWFEVITGQSCLENSYRPKYFAGDVDMSPAEDLIQMLQKSAHKAVEQAKSAT